MGENGDLKAVRSVTLELSGSEGRIEKLLLKPDRTEKLRLSGWNQERQLSTALEISEKELVVLIQRAIRAGILSTDFLKNLQDEFEI